MANLIFSLLPTLETWSHIELAVAEHWISQPHAHTLQSLSLGLEKKKLGHIMNITKLTHLVYSDGVSCPHWELSP